MTSVISLSYLSNKLPFFPVKLHNMLADHVSILSADALLQPSSQIHSSQDSNQRPPVQAPSHARCSRQGQGNGKLCLLGINLVSVSCGRI